MKIKLNRFCLLNFQHSEKVTLEQLREDVMEKVIKAVIPAKYLDEETKYHINPCGNFIIGGPMVITFLPFHRPIEHS